MAKSLLLSIKLQTAACKDAKALSFLLIGLCSTVMAADTTCNTSGVQQTNGTNSIACGDGAQASANNSIAIGSATQVSAQNSIAIGSAVTATVDNSVYLGNGTVATTAASITSAGMTGLTSGNYAGASPVGIVTIGSVGNEKRIQNVAAGLLSVNSTDAVNGSQLFMTNQALSAVSSGVRANRTRISTNIKNISENTKNISENTKNITQNNHAILQNAQNIATNTTAITNLADNVAQGINIAGNAGGSNSQLGDTITIIGGLTDGKTASNQNIRTVVNNGTVDIQIAERPQFTEVVLSEALTISQGANINMGGNQVHNVAAGTALNDAVNFGQLQKLSRRVDQVDKDAAAGVAAAMATASLPQPYEAGKSLFSAALGTYRGQQALSIGLSAISDNGQWIIKSAINADTQSNVGASVGFGYQW